MRDCLATGSRDKTIKIWRTSDAQAKLDTMITTIGPVAKLRWRPGRRMHIAR